MGKYKAWATVFVAPKSVGSMTMLRPMNPTSRVGPTASQAGENSQNNVQNIQSYAVSIFRRNSGLKLRQQTLSGGSTQLCPLPRNLRVKDRLRVKDWLKSCNKWKASEKGGREGAWQRGRERDKSWEASRDKVTKQDGQEEGW